jgi:nicotinamidase-related amidase
LCHSLIEVEDSVLIVIDVQERFLAKLPSAERRLLVNRIGWLIDAAAQLDVPIIATAENIPELGGVVPPIAQRLSSQVPVFSKTVFGLAEDREILSAVIETGRSTAILVGLETDVCVAHSALGLIDRGFEVVVVADGTGTPGRGQEIGLERVRRAGGLVSSVKAVYYEWVRTVEGDERFFDQAGTADLPEGVSL